MINFRVFAFAIKDYRCQHHPSNNLCRVGNVKKSGETSTKIEYKKLTNYVSCTKLRSAKLCMALVKKGPNSDLK